TPATIAPHQPPNNMALAMCMMKEVEPLAPSLSCVLRLSSSVATKTSVKSGHQPGNGRRTDQTAPPHTIAAAVTKATNRCIRVWRGMSNRYGGPGPYLNVTPRLCLHHLQPAGRRT